MSSTEEDIWKQICKTYLLLMSNTILLRQITWSSGQNSCFVFKTTQIRFLIHWKGWKTSRKSSIDKKHKRIRDSNRLPPECMPGCTPSCSSKRSKASVFEHDNNYVSLFFGIDIIPTELNGKMSETPKILNAIDNWWSITLEIVSMVFDFDIFANERRK